MKMIVGVVLALVVVAAALPVEEPKDSGLISYENEQQETGYKFKYVSKESERQEEGQLKEVVDEDNKPKQVITVRGSYTYTDKDGNVETINYFADENGYHAEGPSVPKAARR